MEIFSLRLEALRGERTQKQFAAILGVPLNTYTNWVRGINCPKADQIVKICTEFGVSADWLLGIKNEQQTGASKVKNLKTAILAILKDY